MACCCVARKYVAVSFLRKNENSLRKKASGSSVKFSIGAKSQMSSGSVHELMIDELDVVWMEVHN